jgi:TnpA family transposase
LILLAASLKLGHLKAAEIMQTQQVRDKPTTMAKALSEIGRISKTIHILRYINNQAFRLRVREGQNFCVRGVENFARTGRLCVSGSALELQACSSF